MIQFYRNPILPGFHPDPSICRAGEDYYLATSSFHWFPGVPIHHSRDLVNWRLIGHALDRPGQLPLREVKSSEGIYAPTLRFHEGMFYLITTNVTRGGNFLVTAKDPAGPWSEPVWLRDLPGIDPSLLFDADGTVYVQSSGEGKGIVQAELDVQTGRLKTPLRLIWTGTGGRYPEGPHLYRLGNAYYLMIAEGGTEYGHMETIARSDSPWGPFLPCPHNPLLTHRNTEHHPIQATGHADLLVDARGNLWMVCLGIRPCGGRFHHLGRETFLAPAAWAEGHWPRIYSGRLLELEMQADLPPASPWPEPSVRDDFNGPALDKVWNFLRNPQSGWWSLDQRAGHLRIKGLAEDLDTPGTPALIARRQQHFKVQCRIQIDFAAGQEGEEAGLTIYMDERHHAEVFLTFEQGERYVGLRWRIGPLVAVLKRERAGAGPVVLGWDARTETAEGFWHRPGGTPLPLGMIEYRYLSSETAGGFTGAYFGLYATGHGRPCQTPADMDWCDYEPRD